MALSEKELIFNMALGQVGDYEITDGQTSEKQYVICDRFYENAKKRTIKAHPWNETTKRKIVVQEEFGPIYEFLYKYTLPTDSLKVLSISPEGIDTILWEVESGFIKTNCIYTPQTWSDDSILYSIGEYVTLSDITYLCNVNNTSATANSPATDTTTWTTAGGDFGIIFLRYIWNNTDPSTYSEDLKNAIATQLGILISPHLENDTATKNNLIQEFEQVTMPKARSVDAQEGKPRKYFHSKWIRSRSRGTSLRNRS